MKGKTGRFNYLINGEASPDSNEDTQRFEYKQIISKLTREHQPIEHILPNERSPQRTYSPIGHVLQLKSSPNNHEIRSIILNEQLTPIKKQETKTKIDAYRIIKDSHLLSDQEMKDFQEKGNNNKVYYSPFKQHKPPEYQPTIIKFYQVKSDPQPKDGRKVNTVKNNQPYINQPIQCYQQPQKSDNPELKRTTPPKTGDMKMSRTKSNKAYKVAKHPEPVEPAHRNQDQAYYYPQQQDLRYRVDHTLKEKIRKRSCYDYVPQEMKARLRRLHQN